MSRGDPSRAGAVEHDIASLPVGYHTVSSDWRITFVNAAAEAILGRPAATLVGRDLWAEFPDARDQEVGRVYERVMTTGRPAAFDAFYPGLEMWFELRVQPVGEGIGVYFLDITARKQAERRALDATRRAEFLRETTDALSADLDVVGNVNRLARLVVPYLGSWSIVSIVEPATDGEGGTDGRLVDSASWHVDPARRDAVAGYAEVRQAALPGTLAHEAVLAGRPMAVMRDAHERIRERLTGVALERFDALAPVASAVLPMVARGRTVGMLSIYADEPWSDDRYEAAKDVATRAALALDNSLAYERARVAKIDAEAARAETEAANERLALLVRVSEELTGSDPDVAVGNLARLVVPQLADWSIVTLVDDEGGLHDVGVAHADPHRQRDTEEYADRRSATLSTDSPLMQVLRTGTIWRSGAIAESYVRQVQTSQAAADLASSLDPYGVAVIPLVARERVFGALTIVTTTSRGSHTDDELAVAAEVARRAAPVLDSAQSAHRVRRLAESMQRSVLSVPPAPPGLDIATRYRPARADNEVGGDWYDHFDLPDGTTFVAIGDVMGHDTAAIAAMAQLRTLMRAAAWTTGRHSPADVITDTDSANRALGPRTLATALTAILAARPDGSVAMRWSAAGHPPALVVSPDGSARYLEPDAIDVPLGVVWAEPRRDHVTDLAPGSLVVLFTDGLVERRGRTLDAGLDLLCRFVVERRHAGLDELLDKMLIELAPADTRHDDIAILALRVADGANTDRDRLLLQLPFDTSAPGLARARLADYLGELSVDQRHDAAVLASELVTNALRHGEAPITLEIRRVPGGVRVAVGDHGPRYPVLPDRDPATSHPSGRGMLITDRLASSWGVDAAPIGKSVWFSLVATT